MDDRLKLTLLFALFAVVVIGALVAEVRRDAAGQNSIRVLFLLVFSLCFCTLAAIGTLQVVGLIRSPI
jgi:hypothetical protein